MNQILNNKGPLLTASVVLPSSPVTTVLRCVGLDETFPLDVGARNHHWEGSHILQLKGDCFQFLSVACLCPTELKNATKNIYGLQALCHS